MRIFLFFIIIINLFAEDYRVFQIEKLIKEMQQKKIHFIPMDEYNIFPIHIDRRIDVQKYLKQQSVTLDVKAIMGNMVFINGKWYKKGDKIGNILIYNINNRCVTFKVISKVINKTFDICLFKDVVKVVK